MFKRTIILLASLVLLLTNCTAYAVTSAEKEKQYIATVLQLEEYLSEYKNDGIELEAIYRSFNDLRGYEQSKFLGYYVSLLIKISNGEYDYEMRTFMNMIERNKEFNEYLKNDLKGSPIGTVEEFKSYVAAREYEKNGEVGKAVENYEDCLNYYDASERYYSLSQDQHGETYNVARALLRAGKLEEAYFSFSSVAQYEDSQDFMEAIVEQLGYIPSKESASSPISSSTPSPMGLAENAVPETAEETLPSVLTLNVSTSNGINNLTWNAISGAESYIIRRHQTNKAYADLVTIKQTSYKDTQVSLNFRYFYTVIAKMPNGKTIVSNEEIITVRNDNSSASKPNPTEETHQVAHFTAGSTPAPQVGDPQEEAHFTAGATPTPQLQIEEKYGFD